MTYDPAVQMARELDQRADEIRASYERGEEPTEPLRVTMPVYVPKDIGNLGASGQPDSPRSPRDLTDLASAFVARASGVNGATTVTETP